MLVAEEATVIAREWDLTESQTSAILYRLDRHRRPDTLVNTSHPTATRHHELGMCTYYLL